MSDTPPPPAAPNVEAITTPRSAKHSLRPMLMLGVAFIIATCVVAAVVALVHCLNSSGPEGLKPIAARKPAQLAMATLEGKNWSLADQAGKVVVINYFATWCPPCVEETPDLVDLANQQAAKGVAVAGVSLDADQSAERTRVPVLKEFQQQYHAPFPILLPSLGSPLFATTFPLPQTVLVDRHGRTARVILGAFDAANLRESIDLLLKEP